MTDLDPVRMAAIKGNSLWHADMAFSHRRALYSIIRAVELPSAIWGETQSTWIQGQPTKIFRGNIKQRIEPLIANNSLFHNRKLASPEVFKSMEPLNYPMARHRLVVPHEGSGRKNF